MNQCVPSWNLDNGSPHHLIPPPTSSLMVDDYEVAELRWANGHLEMHGHRAGGASRSAVKPPLGFKEAPAAVASWEKPRASGTLEAVVNQAIRVAVVPVSEPAGPNGAAGAPCIVPSLPSKNPYGRHLLSACPSVVPAAAAADAVVPCSKLRAHGGGDETPVPDSAVGPTDGVGNCVGSWSVRKRASRRGASDANCSLTESAASRGLTFDTTEIGFATSASPIHGSPETENTNCRRPLTHVDHLDSGRPSRRIKKHGGHEEEKTKGDVRSASSKRSRAAAVHNQSERKRRDRINQKMKTLQKLVPNSNKTDKASILDEAIVYLKQLQAQVQVMSRMGSVPPMMMPNMAMQHMQMAVMAQMAQMSQMGMGMGMMNMNSLGRAEQSGGAVSPPATLILPQPGSWDIPGAERLQTPPGSVLPPADPFAQLMAGQNQQPSTAAVDAYGRMAALYRQLYQQQPGPNQKT